MRTRFMTEPAKNGLMWLSCKGHGNRCVAKVGSGRGGWGAPARLIHEAVGGAWRLAKDRQEGVSKVVAVEAGPGGLPRIAERVLPDLA